VVPHPAAVKAHNRAKEARSRAAEAHNGPVGAVNADSKPRPVSHQFHSHQFEDKNGSSPSEKSDRELHRQEKSDLGSATK
jgi:hypothetical protein